MNTLLRFNFSFVSELIIVLVLICLIFYTPTAHFFSRVSARNVTLLSIYSSTSGNWVILSTSWNIPAGIPCPPAPIWTICSLVPGSSFFFLCWVPFPLSHIFLFSRSPLCMSPEVKLWCGNIRPQHLAGFQQETCLLRRVTCPSWVVCSSVLCLIFAPGPRGWSSFCLERHQCQARGEEDAANQRWPSRCCSEVTRVSSAHIPMTKAGHVATLKFVPYLNFGCV